MTKEYAKYLNSKEWKAIRLLVLDRDKNKCTNCGFPNKLHVHHKHYKNIFNEELDDLITLCTLCHSKVHKILKKAIAKRKKNGKQTKNDKEFGKYRKTLGNNLYEMFILGYDVTFYKKPKKKVKKKKKQKVVTPVKTKIFVRRTNRDRTKYGFDLGSVPAQKRAEARRLAKENENNPQKT